MTEGIWVALIAAISGVVVVLIQQGRQHKRAKAQSETLEVVRDQVQNDHGTNLRNDVDKITAIAQRTEAALGYVVDEIKGIRKDIGRLDTRDLEDAADLRSTRDRLNRRIDDIENTLNPGKRQ